MSTPARGSSRGHRVVDHTADQVLEAWGPTRAACLEESASAFVALFADELPETVVRDHELALEAADAGDMLLDLLGEIIWLADAHGLVPRTTRVRDLGDRVEVRMALVTLTDATPTGPSPKGLSHSGLVLEGDDAGWHARAIVDI